MSLAERRFSTGMKFLDQRVDGGIPVGSTVALAAPAGSQSELLLRVLTESRRLLYLSTVCPDEDELRAVLEPYRSRGTELLVDYASPEGLLDQPEAFTSQIPPESFVVVDAMNGLERGPRTPYLEFLNAVKRRTREADSVAFFHCLYIDGPPPAERAITLKRADHVWQLRTLFLSNEIKHRLLVTKARGYRVLTESIPIILTDRVQIDTSRNI